MLKTISVSFLALVAATPALAQSVGGQEDAVTRPGDQIVVTATRSDEGVAIDQLGGSATVITAQDLRDRQVTIVSDVLRDVPGIAVSRTGAIGGLTQVRIRGAEGNHTLVLIDGIEASDPTYGEYDFATLVADDAARVEVLRGEQSALYGSDAIGGVIQYLTPTGRERPGVSGRIEGGSFGTFQGAARAAGVAGAFDYALTGSLLATDGYVVAPGGSRRIGSNIATVGGRIGVDLGAVALRAILRYNRTDADLNDQDYFVTGNAIDSGGHYENDAFYGLVGARVETGGLTSDLSAQLHSSKRDYFDDADTLYMGTRGKRTKLSWVSTLDLGGEGIAHSLTGAIDYEDEQFRNRGAVSAANPVRHIRNWGFVGQYNLSIGESGALGLAVRHDANSRFRDATTWRAQGSWTFDFGTRLHASAGTGVKAPSFSELYGYSPTSGYVGNPNLKPEESFGWEIGVEQRFLDGRARIDVTYFSADLEDKIVSTFSPVYTSINAPGTSPHTGVEVSVDAVLGAGFRFNASYTHLDAENEAGVTLIRRAGDIGSANLAWRSPDERFGINLTVRHNGEQLDTNFATYVTAPLPAFTLVNLGVDVRILDNLTIYGRVENLFDTDYVENVGFRSSGIGAYGGVRFSF